MSFHYIYQICDYIYHIYDISYTYMLSHSHTHTCTYIIRLKRKAKKNLSKIQAEDIKESCNKGGMTRVATEMSF